MIIRFIEYFKVVTKWVTIKIWKMMYRFCKYKLQICCPSVLSHSNFCVHRRPRLERNLKKIMWILELVKPMASSPQYTKNQNCILTDGMGTILLAETERDVIPHWLLWLPWVLTVNKPKYSRNAAWNRLKASSCILAAPYLRGHDLEGKFLCESESLAWWMNHD